jgi:hypothetical protein
VPEPQLVAGGRRGLPHEFALDEVRRLVDEDAPGETVVREVAQEGQALADGAQGDDGQAALQEAVELLQRVVRRVGDVAHQLDLHDGGFGHAGHDVGAGLDLEVAGAVGLQEPRARRQAVEAEESALARDAFTGGLSRR